jgi:tetratricopeptide (TPR) repeat protein
MDKDDYDNALRFYERAMALEPNNVDVLDAAADACIEVCVWGAGGCVWVGACVRAFVFVRASRTLQAGHAERAISLLLRSIELQPGVNWHK